jgi:hypothetical protein
MVGDRNYYQSISVAPESFSYSSGFSALQFLPDTKSPDCFLGYTRHEYEGRIG